MAVGTLKLCKDPSPLSECGTQKLCPGTRGVPWYWEEEIWLRRFRVTHAQLSALGWTGLPVLLFLGTSLTEWEVERPRL